MIQVDEPTVETVREIGAPGAGAVRVVRPEHDVVGEELRAAVEQLGERLPARLGVELVVLLDRHPGEGAAPALELLAPLRLLGFELRELAARGLPFVTGTDGVLGHVVSSRTLLVRTGTPGSGETHREPRHAARRSRTPGRRCGGSPPPAPRLCRNRVSPSVESSSSATTQVTRPSAP